MKLNMQFQSSVYPREMLTYVHKKTSIIIFLLTFLILTKHWKELKNLEIKGEGGVVCRIKEKFFLKPTTCVILGGITMRTRRQRIHT